MPELIVDKSKCLKNIVRMVKKARVNGLSFRPHCKTHQSAEIASWFREFNVTKITVSSFSMASYFAAAGWSDILVAFPFDPGQLTTLKKLSEKTEVSVLIDNLEVLSHLKKVSRNVKFYIDIDTGYGRTGIPAANLEQITRIIQESTANRHLPFSGFYCHACHSYKTAVPAERTAIHQRAIADLTALKNEFSRFNPRVLYGDTPNCSTQSDFNGIDEITPGNFVFYDLIQHHLGSCNLEDIAVAVACPVVGKYPDHRRVVIHGGGVHFSKEQMVINNSLVFGQLLNPASSQWMGIQPEQYITSLSQEHGILEHCGEWMEKVSIGQILKFLPVHSCMTANLLRNYKTTDGRLITTNGT